MTAEKWVPIIEVPVDSLKVFLERKKREGFSILGLEQTANSVPLDQYSFPKKTVRYSVNSVFNLNLASDRIWESPVDIVALLNFHPIDCIGTGPWA